MNLNGKIIRGIDGLYEIRLTGGETVLCKAKGAFRHESVVPYVGDNVTLSESGGSFMISDIMERKNVIIRPPVANIDLLFIVVACAAPEPLLSNVDKLVSIAEHKGIEPCVIVTKADIAHDEAVRIYEIYKKAGISAFITDVFGSENNELRSYIVNAVSSGNKTAVFAGSSGVGKSTLINSLFPAMHIKTGEISRKTERGKHTTRHVELFPLETLTSDSETHGYLSDTPGFSLIDFERFDFYDKEDLPFNFREFAPYLGKCKYTKCTHTKEEGCKILEAVRNGIIPPSRHESFLEIYEALKDKKNY